MGQLSDKEANTKALREFVKGIILRVILGTVAPAAIFLILQYILKIKSIETPRWFVPECIYVWAVFLYALISMYIGFPYAIKTQPKKVSENEAQARTDNYNSTIRPRYNPRSNKYYVQVGGERISFDKEPTQAEIEELIMYHSVSETPKGEKKNTISSGRLAALFFAIFLFSWSSILFSSKFINAKVIEHTFIGTSATVTKAASYFETIPGDSGHTKTIKKYDVKYEYEYDGQQDSGAFKSPNKYTEGSHMTVYINPSAPSEKYIKSEIDNGLIWFYFIIGTICMIVFFKIMIYLFMT